MKKLILLSVLSLFIASCSNVDHSKDKIIVYGDYKCPFCKKLELQIMPKLKKHYIYNNKADYRFINVAFLGRDSVEGAKAAKAVENIAPKQFLKFQELIYKKQSKNQKDWLTHKTIDEQINKLNISNKKKREIKNSYKKDETIEQVKDDIKESKKNKINKVPSVYINNKKVENPLNYQEYREALK